MISNISEYPRGTERIGFSSRWGCKCTRGDQRCPARARLTSWGTEAVGHGTGHSNSPGELTRRAAPGMVGARSVGQHLPAETVDQLLDQDRAEPNNEIAGDAMVMIEAKWRILVGVRVRYSIHTSQGMTMELRQRAQRDFITSSRSRTDHLLATETSSERFGHQIGRELGTTGRY